MIYIQNRTALKRADFFMGACGKAKTPHVIKQLLVATDFHSMEKKILIFFNRTEGLTSYRFGTAWGWETDDTMFILSELSLWYGRWHNYSAHL